MVGNHRSYSCKYPQEDGLAWHDHIRPQQCLMLLKVWGESWCCYNSQMHQSKKSIPLVRQDQVSYPFSFRLTPFKCFPIVDYKQISNNTPQKNDGKDKTSDMNYNAQHISVLKFLAFLLYPMGAKRSRGKVSLHNEKKSPETFHQISFFVMFTLGKKNDTEFVITINTSDSFPIS